MLDAAGKAVCIVFNKIDKVKSGQVERKISEHLQDLTVGRDTAVVPFSAVNGTGKRALWAWIEERLSL